jgi:hypothetical protein
MVRLSDRTLWRYRITQLWFANRDCFGGERGTFRNLLIAGCAANETPTRRVSEGVPRLRVGLVTLSAQSSIGLAARRSVPPRAAIFFLRPLPRLHQWGGDEGAQHVKKMAVVSSVCKSLQGCSTRFTEGGVS